MSVKESKNWFACLSFCRSCWRTPRAACTEARASTVALKLSRKAAASRYSRLASASNSRISATRSVRTRRVRRRAMPRSSDLRIGDNFQCRVEIDRIVVFGFHLQMAHLNFIRGLFDRRQQRKELRKRHAIEPKVNSGFLIALDDNGGCRLRADDRIANLRRCRRFFHKRQQRELSGRARHARFELSHARLIEQVILRHERQFLTVFCFSPRLPVKLVYRGHKRVDDQQKHERCRGQGSTGGRRDALARRRWAPPL